MGVIVGFLSGLLGIGGGVVLVPLQYFLLQSSGVNSSLALLISFGTSLAIIIPTSISGAYRHVKDIPEVLHPGIKLGMFGVIGGFIGGLVASISPTQILEYIFGILLIILAVYNLITMNKKAKESTIEINIFLTVFLGLLIGFLSGLLGIGGGVFIIGILSIFLGYSMKEAIGMSSVFICFAAIGGLISYVISGLGVNTLPYSIGYINLIHFGVIILFSVPLAYIGAKVADNVSDKKLTIIYTLVILVMALKILGIIPDF
ncbi:sulfite exporter TauE/SafE family protein [Methanobrevibacter sp. OttesenSCG-928-I08]|nr:sulfite exporter TauE/SafE family protein [Methanobrevibacter sp. OttesenSCG-928-I08]